MREDYTAIALIIDRSGSMSGVEEDTIGGVNSFIEQQREVEGDASVLMLQFDREIETIHDFVAIKEVKELTSEVYFPRNSTSLLDAIGFTIIRLGKILEQMSEPDRPAKVIVAVLTDGQENTSSEFSKKQIKEMIKRQEEVYKWDFNFISADLNSFEDAREYGFAPGKTALYSKGVTGATFGALSMKMSRVRKSSMKDYNRGASQDFTDEELRDMSGDS
jgi:hypothetical protein